jgi:hypothetical protein
VDLTPYLPDSALGYVNLAGIVISASAIACASISKYTKNKTDDKIAGWLKKAHDLLSFVGLQPKLDAKRAADAYKPAPGGRTVVHDLRARK